MRRTRLNIAIGFMRLPEGEARTKNFTVRMSATEIRAIRDAAMREKADVPEWARKRLLGDLTAGK